MTVPEKVLIAAPDFPYPPNHGGRVDIWKRMLTLKEMGYEIDLVATVKEPPTAQDAAVVSAVAGKVVTVSRRKEMGAFLGWRPHQVMDRAGLAEVELEGRYDFVLIEGSPCEMILHNPTLKADHKIVRVHNNEPLYFRKLAFSTKNPAKFLYYIAEALRFTLSEWKLYTRIRHYLFISRDEYLSFLARHKDKHAIFLPPSVEPPKDSARTMEAAASRRVLFIGSLFMPNNKDGVLWYLNEVHPKLRKIEGYRFVVAGNSKGTSLSWLTENQWFEEIEFHDSPPDLSALYAGAAVFVNPMRFGAGMKIKTIEALCQGLPMVSTSTGTEGTGLEDGRHLYCTDEAESFAKHVESLLANPQEGAELVLQALDYIGREFSAREKLQHFLTCVKAE